MNASFLILAASLGGDVQLSSEWESPGVIFFKIFAILFLVLLNGFFVASEFAIVKVRGSQLDALSDEGNTRATFARNITRHLDANLSATQLGITLSSLGLGIVSEKYLGQVFSPAFYLVGITNPSVISWTTGALVFCTITYLHIVLGELAPKSLAIRRPVETTLWVARPLDIFRRLLTWAIAFLNGTANWLLKKIFGLDPVTGIELAHSEEELRLIVTESNQSDEVSSLGKEILINALDMRRRVVRDIMTPRGKVVHLDIGNTFEENVRIAQESSHTRFPLCQDHLDNVIGLIHIKDLFSTITKNEPDLLAIKRELHPVPEMMPLEKLLNVFLTHHAHLAVVVDEYGGTVGIVTLDNVLAELVGDIQDEFDFEQPEFVRLNENEFAVAGGLALYELQDLADLHIESPEVSTVGGYITHLIGHLPQEGETIETHHYLVTVTKTDGRSIAQLHFKKLAPETAEDEIEQAS